MKYMPNKLVRLKMACAMLFIVLGSFLFFVATHPADLPITQPAPTTLETLPSQADIQQMLVDLGADIKVDGCIGADSRREWDLLTNQKLINRMWPKGE